MKNHVRMRVVEAYESGSGELGNNLIERWEATLTVDILGQAYQVTVFLKCA